MGVCSACVFDLVDEGNWFCLKYNICMCFLKNY